MVGDERRADVGQWDRLLMAVSLAVIIGLILMAPGGVLDRADRAAYAVCHRIPGHSFILDGRPLPLCARCSGTYLGALAGFLVLFARGRGRASALPQKRYLAVLAGFLLLWAADGANSYLHLMTGRPFVYEPQNSLRLITGALEGLVISVFLLPLLNFSFWRQPTGTPSIANGRDLAWMLVGAAVTVGVVGSGWDGLLYPLALLSGLMVLLLVGAVNSMIVLMLLRREGRASRWQQVAPLLVAGVALATMELTAIGWGRDALTQALGLPF